MKLLKNTAIVTASFLLISFTQASLAQEMVYKNQRGSIMKMVLHPQEGNTGTITGTFTTAVGKCKTAMPITGFFNGNAVSISVNFSECKQVLAITGNLLENNDALYTLFLETSQSTDPMGKDLSATIVGSDYYKREKK